MNENYDVTKDITAAERICDTIDTYCVANNIPKFELARMCGFHGTAFSPSYMESRITKEPDKLQKIIDATGWTLEQLLGEVPVTECKNPGIEYIKQRRKKLTKPKAKRLSIEKREKPKNVTETPKEYSITVDNDGNKHYICSYDVIEHVTKELTREEFLKEV
jgi:hypothetical protein